MKLSNNSILLAILTIFGCLCVESTVVDPWIFESRHELYNSILNGTHLPSIFGNDNQGNLLWGLPIQLVWQFNSGRLETTTLSSQQHRINERSWWASMNYYLSVIPYLSAMNRGLVPVVEIAPPKTYPNSLFCLTYASCDKSVMSNWDNYFDAYIQLSHNSSALTLDQLLKIMWIAHTGSIRYSGSRLTDYINLLPPKEKNFGNGWGNFVEVLDIVGFNTNFTNVNALGVNLPPRMLSLFDFPPFIHDMTRPQNNVAASMLTINDITKLPLVWNGALETLRGLELIPQCHDLILHEINDFITNPIDTILELLGKKTLLSN
ncbi:hypothetical protein PPL_01588 [Heterostelium album PN500]|uniref:Uncharacterized protein n=1 Tax=Heterostelium pallidum (strain ATCC 26659 / Pp 5 / PN500) TaxID=670386 RepID=D3AZX4_HETP5|nr:hypothetical protein PPL_01588 [Heterostelium album PN500]EFA84598.1 hypothetical protein PPL_01588 [Heterostelium album PN500]|eukprot:XP_020436711.1 hypothetical protein PPL_01588 [Heterostelium album PN500]